jgi:glucose/arabinose dehydrogenase
MRKVISLVAAGAVVFGFAAPASAKPPSPPWRVATGLDNPRGLTIGPHGELFVAEAGKGGAGPCRTGAEGGQVCFGASGAITEVVRGEQRRIAHGLPSEAGEGGAQAIGPSDVTVGRDGKLYFTVGLGGNPALRGRLTYLRNNAKLFRLTGHGPAVVADPGAFEARVNPDGVQPPDTNPNAVLGVRGGELVVDAGGNSLLKAGSRGHLSKVAVFGSLPGPVQAVPTSVVAGPDGAYYVGELTGAPFPAGAARVWRIVPGRPPTVYATGFTNIIDLAWGPDRRLYVLEIAQHGLASGDLSGALLRVEPSGPPTTIVGTGLTAPGGLAIGGHYAYVSNFSVFAGQGEVLKYPLHS